MTAGEVARSFLMLSLLVTAIQCNGPRESAKLGKDAMTPSSTAEPMDSGAIQRMVGSISNTDVRWDGTFIGLTPTVVSESARQLLAWGGSAAPHLVRALEDESRFVVAHVLLTLMSGAEYHAVPWNGLKLDLLPDGQVKIDARQRFELAQRWQKWLQSSPPRTSVRE